MDSSYCSTIFILSRVSMRVWSFISYYIQIGALAVGRSIHELFLANASNQSEEEFQTGLMFSYSY